MIGNWEISGLKIDEKFFRYSIAYLDASVLITTQIDNNQNMESWPHASVAIMLAVHSVELFLKSTILLSEPKRILQSHKLEDLKAIFDEIYPEKKNVWELPFKTEYLGMSEEEAAALAKREPIPSIQYRYPVDMKGKAWGDAAGFLPQEFLSFLEDLKDDFNRIYSNLKRT